MRQGRTPGAAARYHAPLLRKERADAHGRYRAGPAHDALALSLATLGPVLGAALLAVIGLALGS
ncbi:hypothetical protein OPKNFCMD_0925 [Methylobacterium crusticola]|uniref:Uncharacterized protein n=1 Tax=Methylobacterium crusticola TaxID=1697972 RepID=A0ABQ4QSJ9_9HYPH|nr:hypothetical protein [Methylobacterium crusticola]GJD48209.1 hypothetical protein OPKNFCMD_0925 [Methylobacterium crusticola]